MFEFLHFHREFIKTSTFVNFAEGARYNQIENSLFTFFLYKYKGYKYTEAENRPENKHVTRQNSIAAMHTIKNIIYNQK